MSAAASSADRGHKPASGRNREDFEQSDTAEGQEEAEKKAQQEQAEQQAVEAAAVVVHHHQQQQEPQVDQMNVREERDLSGDILITHTTLVSLVHSLTHTGHPSEAIATDGVVSQ